MGKIDETGVSQPRLSSICFAESASSRFGSGTLISQGPKHTSTQQHVGLSGRKLQAELATMGFAGKALLPCSCFVTFAMFFRAISWTLR